MKKNAYIAAFILGFIVIILTSCGKDKSPTEPKSPAKEPIVSQNTMIVKEDVNLTLDTVADNSLTFSFSGSIPDISTGDILVSKESNSYLRKVTSVTTEGDKITVNTENATLTDAVVQGEIDTTITLNLSTQKIGKGTGVLKTVKGVSLTEDGIDLSGVELYSGKIDDTYLIVNITDGSINFEPNLDIGIDIENSTINKFYAIAQGDLHFDFDLHASANGEINHEEEINLITLGYVAYQQIGPVPIVELITLEFIAGFETIGNGEVNLNTGLDYMTKIQVGAQYVTGTWSPVWPKKPEGKSHETEWTGNADLKIRGYVRPCITVKFYAVAGPYLDIEPYLGFYGNVGGEYAWYWELSGGIESNIGFDVSVLGYGIADYTTELVALETVIASDFKESIKPDPPNITFVSIPGGTFQMGSNFENDSNNTLKGEGYFSDEQPIHQVTISKFEMSTTEITNEIYSEYLNDIWPSGNIEITDVEVDGFDWTCVIGKSGEYYNLVYFRFYNNIHIHNDRFYPMYENHKKKPVTNVTWYGAKAFAEFYGLDLPTEAEWEYACRGGRQYEYGTDDGTFNRGINIYDIIYFGQWGPFDIGIYPQNPYGLYDMSGNVSEWCNDWYESEYYRDSPVYNPSGPVTGTEKVIRGGEWNSMKEYLRSATRRESLPYSIADDRGFRAVRRP